MELKVWCDGIQRIVCGATASTTCQDVVFALAHATGQTGRFILIEKWKNNERVLAPSDQPIVSLAKWGEFVNDVTFIMKKSGDVSTSNAKQCNNRLPTPKLSKKSDTDLANQKRKKLNMENSGFSKSLSSIEPCHSQSSSPLLSNMRVSSNLNNGNSTHSPIMNTSSQGNLDDHKCLSSMIKENNRMNYVNQVINPEPLYGTLNPNRPRKPPPYKEAIAKSSLVNIINNSNYSNNFDHSYITKIKTDSSHHQPSFNHENINQVNSNKALIAPSVNNINPLTIQEQKTINLISIQQKTLKKQGKNMADLENEIDIVQRKLSDNEFVVNRYRDEMEYLHQRWIDQEMLIEKLESENLEHELEKLINDGKHYEDEMKEIKLKLSNCENEVTKRRDEICKLMSKIEEYFHLNLGEFDNLNDPALIDRLKMSIQEKNNKIQHQKMDLDVLNDSIDHVDETIKAKNNVVDKLILQIKEANVEGLTLQSSTIPIEMDKNSSNTDQTYPKTGTNRRIPVSLHELGNTVPTKKNPDGIWV